MIGQQVHGADNAVEMEDELDLDIEYEKDEFDDEDEGVGVAAADAVSRCLRRRGEWCHRHRCMAAVVIVKAVCAWRRRRRCRGR